MTPAEHVAPSFATAAPPEDSGSAPGAERLAPLSKTEWEQSTELCVSCPDCAFTFDATHHDMDGDYTCPLCVELRFREALERVYTETTREGAAYTMRAVIANIHAYAGNALAVDGAEGAPALERTE